MTKSRFLLAAVLATTHALGQGIPTLQCTNPVLGRPFTATIHAGADAHSVLLVSSLSRTGTVSIGPLVTALAQDWAILDQRFTGGSSQHSFQLPLPTDPSLDGLEFLLQGIVFRPLSGSYHVTNAAELKIVAPLAQGRKHVLILRQTIVDPAIANSAAQADALAVSLGQRGHRVQLADDVLPNDIQGFDLILDARFTTRPSASESVRLRNFLMTSGGLFFVAGPSVNSVAGQFRSAWIETFLNVDLGIPVTVVSGLGYSNGSALEAVSPDAPVSYLTVPQTIAVLPYDVEREGGHFGPPGWQSTVTPWISGGQGSSALVYGGLFGADAIQAFPASGRVAVLFSGSGHALGGDATRNPNAPLVFDNLVHWLDAP